VDVVDVDVVHMCGDARGEGGGVSVGSWAGNMIAAELVIGKREIGCLAILTVVMVVDGRPASQQTDIYKLLVAILRYVIHCDCTLITPHTSMFSKPCTMA